MAILLDTSNSTAIDTWRRGQACPAGRAFGLELGSSSPLNLFLGALNREGDFSAICPPDDGCYSFTLRLRDCPKCGEIRFHFGKGASCWLPVTADAKTIQAALNEIPEIWQSGCVDVECKECRSWVVKWRKPGKRENLRVEWDCGEPGARVLLSARGAQVGAFRHSCQYISLLGLPIATAELRPCRENAGWDAERSILHLPQGTGGRLRWWREGKDETEFTKPHRPQLHNIHYALSCAFGFHEVEEDCKGIHITKDGLPAKDISPDGRGLRVPTALVGRLCLNKLLVPLSAVGDPLRVIASVSVRRKGQLGTLWKAEMSIAADILSDIPLPDGKVTESEHCFVIGETDPDCPTPVNTYCVPSTCGVRIHAVYHNGIHLDPTQYAATGNKVELELDQLAADGITPADGDKLVVNYYEDCADGSCGCQSCGKCNKAPSRALPKPPEPLSVTASTGKTAEPTSVTSSDILERNTPEQKARKPSEKEPSPSSVASTTIPQDPSPSQLAEKQVSAKEPTPSDVTATT